MAELLQVSLPHQAPPFGRGRGQGGGGGRALRGLSRVVPFPCRVSGCRSRGISPLSPWSADRGQQQACTSLVSFSRLGPAGGPTACGSGLVGARASGIRRAGQRLDSRRYESHPTGPPSGPARARGLGATLLPSARSAPAPGPAPPQLPRGDPLDALSRPKQRRTGQTPHRPTPPPTPPASPAAVTHHQDELSSHEGARAQRQVQAGSPEGGEQVRRSRW